MNYVLHTHYSENKVQRRKTGVLQLLFKGGEMKVKGNSFEWVTE
jgi:hypothetical protein